jgi:beta-galactosidase
VVTLPHDWAIKGPFNAPKIGTNMANMAKLRINGVGWYRRKISRSTDEEGKSFLLDIDGAISYASV